MELKTKYFVGKLYVAICSATQAILLQLLKLENFTCLPLVWRINSCMKYPCYYQTILKKNLFNILYRRVQKILWGSNSWINCSDPTKFFVHACICIHKLLRLDPKYWLKKLYFDKMFCIWICLTIEMYVIHI